MLIIYFNPLQHKVIPDSSVYFPRSLLPIMLPSESLITCLPIWYVLVCFFVASQDPLFHPSHTILIIVFVITIWFEVRSFKRHHF